MSQRGAVGGRKPGVSSACASKKLQPEIDNHVATAFTRQNPPCQRSGTRSLPCAWAMSKVFFTLCTTAQRHVPGLALRDLKFAGSV